ncbi:collagen alpha-1(I) chain-like [Camelus ferus]|uniref:Collagen alpha-1(I) chain-like n=1 Tax=Camelus ferus TaxID=419612 RepID=A0A8B8TPY8_CAMFR|nr:collagen alpha-1(I) chain-like [Camelus ferus]
MEKPTKPAIVPRLTRPLFREDVLKTGSEPSGTHVGACAWHPRECPPRALIKRPDPEGRARDKAGGSDPAQSAAEPGQQSGPAWPSGRGLQTVVVGQQWVWGRQGTQNEKEPPESPFTGDCPEIERPTRTRREAPGCRSREGAPQGAGAPLCGAPTAHLALPSLAPSAGAVDCPPLPEPLRAPVRKACGGAGRRPRDGFRPEARSPASPHLRASSGQRGGPGARTGCRERRPARLLLAAPRCASGGAEAARSPGAGSRGAGARAPPGPAGWDVPFAGGPRRLARLPGASAADRGRLPAKSASGPPRSGGSCALPPEDARGDPEAAQADGLAGPRRRQLAEGVRLPRGTRAASRAEGRAETGPALPRADEAASPAAQTPLSAGAALSPGPRGAAATPSPGAAPGPPGERPDSRPHQAKQEQGFGCLSSVWRRESGGEPASSPSQLPGPAGVSDLWPLRLQSSHVLALRPLLPSQLPLTTTEGKVLLVRTRVTRLGPCE